MQNETWKRYELQEQGIDGKWYSRSVSKSFTEGDEIQAKKQIMENYEKLLKNRFSVSSELLPSELKPRKGKLRLCIATIEIVEYL
jgi:hypothetical protein